MFVTNEALLCPLAVKLKLKHHFKAFLHEAYFHLGIIFMKFVVASNYFFVLFLTLIKVPSSLTDPLNAFVCLACVTLYTLILLS